MLTVTRISIRTTIERSADKYKEKLRIKNALDVDGNSDFNPNKMQRLAIFNFSYLIFNSKGDLQNTTPVLRPELDGCSVSPLSFVVG